MQKGAKKKWSAGKKLLAVFCALLLFIGAVLGVLQLGSWHTERSWENWYPDYEKTDIESLLYKIERTEEDYEILYAQTGLTKLGVDGLIARGKTEKILQIQEYYFSELKLDVDHFAPFTYLEEVTTYAPLAALEDGDIIVSATTRVSWWRYGHAALVVDGEGKRIIEATAPGSDSHFAGANSMANLANFMVLRPKAEKQVKAELCTYAKKNLIGLPYRLTTGVFSKKFHTDGVKGTQCAHLVWYAYKKFGLDLDSTGGAVVKPQDMANSPHVELVQVVGFDPEKLWS